MTERKRVYLLFLIMATASLIVATITISVLYRVAYQEEKARLAETAQSQARLIEAIARFDATHSRDYPEGSLAATLSQIIDAHEHYKGFGETGEFTLARREGDRIVFLLSHRHAHLQHPKPIPFDSQLAEPMRRALSGQSGTVAGLDYRGQVVLAAYEPVRELNLGIVAKIDLAEIRAPFVRAGLTAGGFAIVVVLAGAVLFFRISSPMIKRLEKHSQHLEEIVKALGESEKKYHQLVEGLQEGIWVIDKDAYTTFVNPRMAEMLGYTVDEMQGKHLFSFMDERGVEICKRNLERRQQGIKEQHDFELLRKDGTRVYTSMGTSPIIDGEGSYVGALAGVADITERRQAEEALRKAHDELERRVEERTAELVTANEELKREMEERERAEEALGQSEHRYRTLFEESRDPVYITTHEGKFININQAGVDLFGYTREKLMGMNIRELYAHHEDRRKFQKVIERQGSVRDYEVKFRKNDGTELNCLLTSTVRRGDDGTVLGYQGIMRDITDRKRAEEEQTRLQRRQEALLRIARSTDANYETLCDHILAEIMDMTQSRYAFFGFLNKDESVMSLYAWSTEALEDCQIQRKPMNFPISEAGLWGDAVRERTTIIINDCQADHASKKGLPQGHVPLTRILVVPIFSYDRIVALAAVANKPSDYKEEDAEQIEGFATNVQVILERRKMEESLEQSEKELRLLSSQLLTAQEKERKRIAGEIHDGIGQSLTAIKFGVENALKQMDEGTAGTRAEPLEAVIPLTQEAIKEVRRIQTDLRPSLLDDLGILATISWFCREFQTIYSSIRIEKQITIQEDEVPELLKTVIYRVLQEAMNNVAKHSKTNLVGLYLRKTDGQIELVIEDNGRGFDVENTLSLENTKRGLGLSSMKERTELSRGAFSIESTKGNGTTVKAMWPSKE